MALNGTLDVTSTDDRVTFEFTVENDGDDPVTLSFRDAQKAEFAILADDEERWRWSDGRMFAQMLQSETLDPGESVTYDGTWEEPVPGQYGAVATLEATDRSVEARANFTV